MNRQQKRKFIKESQKKGIDRGMAELYLAVKEADANKNPPQNRFQDGDKVKLDVVKIRDRKDYATKTQMYKAFVEANVDTIFTAHLEHERFVSFKERPEWLFWDEFLIKVEDGKERGESNGT